MQSTLFEDLHVALIMDGNGRWARNQGRERAAGHREGAGAVRRVVEVAPKLGIGTLTLYAFSSDNWLRPPDEDATLMDLFRLYLQNERSRCVRRGIRVSVIGRRDRFSKDLLREIRGAEQATQNGSTLHLRLAVDYSARQAILTAATRHDPTVQSNEDEFTRLINQVLHSTPPAPDVDLLVRTSGEQRLSDFMLWESAYAELSFTDTLWPDFGEDDFDRAITEYRGRQRRFGRLPQLNA